MAIKAGQILHDANGFVVDRIQSAGAGNLNIPEEKIYELGNYQTVATVRDIPDLSFDVESFDMSAEWEALLVGLDPTTLVAGQEIDFADCQPMDIISPFKASGAFNIVKGIAIPHLTKENISYRFGVGQNASQSATLRGDSIYYIPGSPYIQDEVSNGSQTVYTLDNTAILYDDSGDSTYALSVTYIFADGTTQRLFHGEDFTDTSAGITLTTAPANGTVIRIVYGSTVAATYPQAVHPTASVKPAAVRAKDIDVYIASASATETFTRLRGVQNFEVSRRVNLENDEEFGNPHFVASDYDTAEVTGTIGIKARDVNALWDIIHLVTNVPDDEIVGPFTSTFVPIELRLNDPDTGAVLKTLYIPDARFTPPPIQGRVQQKLEATFSFSSDGGNFKVYNGDRP